MKYLKVMLVGLLAVIGIGYYKFNANASGDLKKGIYCGVPKFVEHSPFNLIFRDLTNGSLPEVAKDNILFELIDFDVA